MPSSPEVKEYLHVRLRLAKSRALQDEILDIINFHETHATEWDGIEWGFPLRWMRQELRQLANRKVCPDCGRDH